MKEKYKNIKREGKNKYKYIVWMMWNLWVLKNVKKNLDKNGQESVNGAMGDPYLTGVCDDSVKPVMQCLSHGKALKTDSLVSPS